MAYDKVTEEYDQNGKLTKTTKERQIRKTFWYWLQLLIIPAVLAAGAIGFSIKQNNDSLNLNNKQYTQSLTIAATRYVEDQQLAKEQQLEANLQNYLDHMSNLLLDPNLHTKSPQGDNVRILATARTLTILPNLDALRKAVLLKFLHDGGLITRQTQDQLKQGIINPVVNLNGADFSGTDLTGFVLGGADLAVVNFSGAILNRADLNSADLSNANLSDAQLKGATMCFAMITEHAHLSKANLSEALLGGTDLVGADLRGAILTGANLGSNDPTCIALINTKNTPLHRTDLTNADLTGATLTNADLTNVTWSNTICPNGRKSDTNGSGSCGGPSQRNTTTNTWSVSRNGNILQIGYGSGTNFPQYAALDLSSSYFRMVYSTTSQWGTSIVLLPALWSKASCPTDYCQGAPITATWTVGSNLTLSIQGTIATLKVASTVTLMPPANNVFVAQVSTTVTGTVILDNRPGEAFKPVMLSSMRISPTKWDTQAAFIGTQTYTFPSSGWIIQPPILTRNFGLQGGTSAWKTNAPTVKIILNQERQVTGWVTQSNDPNSDNVGFWCATNKVLPSWSFNLTAEAGQNL